MPAAVQMGLELHAVLGELAQLGQREHLKSAAVGQYRAIPVHEAVQPARLGDQILAGAQVQMIGVGEDNLRADLLQFVGRHGFDRGLRAHRHEDGRFDHAVRRVQPSTPRAGLGADVQQLELKGL